MSLRFKLLVAFAVVLTPVLALLLMAFRDALDSEQQTRMDAQMLTARAVAVQVDEAIDASIGLGWAVAQAPVTRTFDPEKLDRHLTELIRLHPLYDSINVFDAEGVNRGWGHLTAPAEPRVRIADRAYFQKVMATNTPQLSDVLELRRPEALGYVVCVPIRDDEGHPMGVVNVVARADMLVRRYSKGWLHPGYALFLADRNGRLAFSTSRPELSPEESHIIEQLPELRAALRGADPKMLEYASPLLNEQRIGAFLATPKFGWGVGVSLSKDVAVASSRLLLRKQLVAWTMLLGLSVLIATWFTRLLSRPVKLLQAQARAIGRGALDERVDLRTGDEFEKLGVAFNDMAGRLADRERALKEAQAELVRKERLAAVGELAAVIAHEVRNPLAVIFNAVAALRRHASSPDETRLHGILQEEADRLNRIVADLLDFARPLRPSVEPAELVLVIREALANALTAGSNIALEEEFPEDLQRVCMDARLIRQALINVASNAVQAMPNGGTLHVRAAHEDVRGTRMVRIDLRDEGAGISPETRARLFEPFFTTKASGTGLGLAVVKRIIEDHAGAIAVDSAPGRGTTFTMWLPVAGASRACA